MVQAIPRDPFGVMEDVFTNREEGGRVILHNGPSGVGKTTVVLHLAEWRCLLGSACILRGLESVQAHQYPPGLDEVVVWVQEPWELRTWKVERGSREREPFEFPNVRRFDSVEELVENRVDGKLNVVYAREKVVKNGVEETTGFWPDVAVELRWREDGAWVDLFLEEAHEVLSNSQGGKTRKGGIRAAQSMAQYRKTLTNAHLIQHKDTEAYHELRNKDSVNLWYQQDATTGARAHPYIRDRLKGLSRGEVFVQVGGKYAGPWQVPDIENRPDYLVKARLGLEDPDTGEFTRARFVILSELDEATPGRPRRMVPSDAVWAVLEEDMSIREAARAYDVPKSTLHKRIQEFRGLREEMA